MKRPSATDLLNRIVEFLDDIQRDPECSQYSRDKAGTLQEDIEMWLEAHELEVVEK